MGRRRRALLQGVLTATALLNAGCASDDGAAKEPATVPPAPGAAVDPAANGTYTGPINRAKDVSKQADDRSAQVDADGTPSP